MFRSVPRAWPEVLEGPLKPLPELPDVASNPKQAPLADGQEEHGGSWWRVGGARTTVKAQTTLSFPGPFVNETME